MKKVIHSKVFRESGANPEPGISPVSESATGAGSDIDPRLQVAFKAWLESEADAAALIHAMSYRVSPGSELASRARNYAARLRLYVARLSALLPLHMRIPYGASAVETRNGRAVTPASCERVEFVLVEYLLHHAEITCEVSLSFGHPLKAGAAERLLRRMNHERRQISDWIRTFQHHRNTRAFSYREDDEEFEPARHHSRERKHETFRGVFAPERSRPSGAPWSGTSRISYNPPQIVRWK